MDPSRFPSGIDSLVSYAHERGLRLGLYTCAGARTCKFNRTGSGGHYEQDANWFAAHHVDLVKVGGHGAWGGAGASEAGGSQCATPCPPAGRSTTAATPARRRPTTWATSPRT